MAQEAGVADALAALIARRARETGLACLGSGGVRHLDVLVVDREGRILADTTGEMGRGDS